MEQEESVLRLSGMRVSLIHHFALIWSFFIILGCTTVNDQNFGSNPRNKDVVVIFPAWVSEQKKTIRFETEAELKSISKCDGGEFELVNVLSYRWKQHNLYSPPYNFIEGNIDCADNSKQIDENKIKSSRTSNLPDCPLPFRDGVIWNNCFVEYTYGGNDEWTGHTYIGEVNNNMWNGKGTYYFNDGSKLSGTWKDGKLSGFGVEIDANNNIVKEGIWENGLFKYSQENTSEQIIIASNELLASKARIKNLEEKLALLENEQIEQQQAISADTQIPLITITRADTDDKQGIIAGKVNDNIGVAEVTVDGNVIPFSSNGSFEYSTYVPSTGKTVEVQVTDLAGLSSSQTVTLERNVNLATASISFDELNPIAKPAKRNNNALALIIGVSNYENTPAKAIYADTDAIVFHDYASEKLGIPNNRIKTLVNDGADEREMLLAVQTWLTRSVKQDQTDVYVFFAGHGLASDDGEQMYLLPYDGSPELLDDTAILRDRLFNDISNSNPRSVTVFLDTCYSGSNRGSEMIIADARPILLKAKDTSVPESFTVFTAAAGDETAKSLEEAKHGLFSYFLMKGMEGGADTNGDKQITAGELHAYVKSNVVQQSSGTQTPELQGDADRVLVRFQ